jgi:hypothetical protein
MSVRRYTNNTSIICPATRSFRKITAKSGLVFCVRLNFVSNCTVDLVQRRKIHTMIIQWYDIFNCNWVASRWQLFSTHMHTNSTENVTKQTIHRTTQKLGRMRFVPRLCGFYPGICLTTEEKIRKKPQSE